MKDLRSELFVEMCVELAAKVRGYFTNPTTGKADIPEELNGDRDLYDLASRITDKVVQPGTRYFPSQIQSHGSNPQAVEKPANRDVQ